MESCIYEVDLEVSTQYFSRHVAPKVTSVRTRCEKLDLRRDTIGDRS